MLHDPFNRTRLPLALMDREQRITALAEAAAALRDGRRVDADAGALLSNALTRWLRDGGDLEQHLGVRGQPGSHATVAALARRFVVAASPVQPLAARPTTNLESVPSSRGQRTFRLRPEDAAHEHEPS